MMGIQTLDLREAVNITDEGVAALTRLTSLRKLNLSSGKLTEKATELLLPLAPRIWELDISNFVVTTKGSLSLQYFTSVHTLKVNCISQEMLVALGTLTQLRSIFFLSFSIVLSHTT